MTGEWSATMEPWHKRNTVKPFEVVFSVAYSDTHLIMRLTMDDDSSRHAAISFDKVGAKLLRDLIEHYLVFDEFLTSKEENKNDKV